MKAHLPRWLLMILFGLVCIILQAFPAYIMRLTGAFATGGFLIIAFVFIIRDCRDLWWQYHHKEEKMSETDSSIMEIIQYLQDEFRKIYKRNATTEELLNFGKDIILTATINGQKPQAVPLKETKP
jgi:hypothetical protein